MMDLGKESALVLMAVDSLHQRFGAGVVILFLKGSKASKIQEWMMHKEGYGDGKASKYKKIFCTIAPPPSPNK